MINPKTQHVRKFLRQTLCKRVYDQCHPINALKALQYVLPRVHEWWQSHRISRLLLVVCWRCRVLVRHRHASYAIPKSLEWQTHWQHGASIGDWGPRSTKRLVSAEFAQAVYRPSQWLHLEFHDKMVVEGLIKAQKQLSAFCNSFPPARDIDHIANCPSDDYLIHLIMSAFKIANCWLHNLWWKWRSISSWCWISRHEWRPQQVCKWWGMKS